MNTQTESSLTNQTIHYHPKGKDSGWSITSQNVREEEGELIADNFLLFQKDGKFFTIQLVWAKAYLPNGDTVEYPAPRIFEVGNGIKCGDIVAQFRKNPNTGRWMVDVEQEFGSPDPENLEETPRIDRSSLNNIKQAVKKAVRPTGMNWTNTQRIGGDKVQFHTVESGWSPQKFNAGKTMDVFEFVANSPDAPGKAAILEALQHLPNSTAVEIAMQIINPPKTNNGK